MKALICHATSDIHLHHTLTDCASKHSCIKRRPKYVKMNISATRTLVSNEKKTKKNEHSTRQRRRNYNYVPTETSHTLQVQTIAFSPFTITATPTEPVHGPDGRGELGRNTSGRSQVDPRLHLEKILNFTQPAQQSLNRSTAVSLVSYDIRSFHKGQIQSHQRIQTPQLGERRGAILPSFPLPNISLPFSSPSLPLAPLPPPSPLKQAP